MSSPRDPVPPATFTLGEELFTLSGAPVPVPENAVGTVEPIRGDRLGEFVLREMVDSATFGQVWLADQPSLGRSVAVKVLRREYVSRPSVVERFRREAQLASRLDHPGAAHVYAFGSEPGGTVWIAMEYVRGITLARLIERDGPFKLAKFSAFFLRLCEAVQSAHDLGIVHRDIKPANVMVREERGELFPKLLDFGLARMALPGGPDAAVQTVAGALMGTPAYMAPEQWASPRDAGPAADQYALGVLAWEALRGVPPFVERDLTRLGVAHREKAPPHLGTAFPPSLDAVLGRALAKLPDARFPSVLDFGAALDRIAGPEFVPGVLDDGWEMEPRVRHLLSPGVDGLDVPALFAAVGAAMGSLRERSLTMQEVPLAEFEDTLTGELRTVVGGYAAGHRSRMVRALEAVRSAPPWDRTLQIVALGVTPKRELDVLLRNLGSDDALITRIRVRVLAHRSTVMGVLEPSARYTLPVDRLAIGEEAGVPVVHVVRAHEADRFLVSLATSRVLLVRVTLDYNGRASVAENVWLVPSGE